MNPLLRTYLLTFLILFLGTSQLLAQDKGGKTKNKGVEYSDIHGRKIRKSQEMGSEINDKKGPKYGQSKNQKNTISKEKERHSVEQRRSSPEKAEPVKRVDTPGPQKGYFDKTKMAKSQEMKKAFSAQKNEPQSDPSSNRKEVKGATYQMLYGKVLAKEAERNANNSGNIDASILENRQANRKAKSDEMNYSGDVDLKAKKEAVKDKARETDYTGNIDLASIQKHVRQKSVETDYSGNIDLHAIQKEVRSAETDRANYEGNILRRDLEKKEAAIRKKGRQIANYDGDILVKSLQHRNREIRKKDKEIANYQGDIVVRRVKQGMHPSAAYRGGKVKNSHEARERLRKRVLKKSQKNGKLQNPEKKQEPKPQYDKNESQIWY